MASRNDPQKRMYMDPDGRTMVLFGVSDAIHNQCITAFRCIEIDQWTYDEVERERTGTMPPSGG